MSDLLSTQEMYDGLSPEQRAEVDRLGEEWSVDVYRGYTATLRKEQRADSTARAALTSPGEDIARALGFGGAVSCLCPLDAIPDPSRRLTPLFRDLQVHPVLFALDRLAFQIAQEVELYTRQVLAEHLGSIAERYGASTATVFSLEGEDRLQAVVTHNTRKPRLEANLHDQVGIVAHVARTGQGYYSNDVRDDRHYREDVPETRSEIAVPIMFPRDRLLGVMNLECRQEAAFNPAHVEELQAAIGVLVPHLLILAALQRNDRSWVPWHADVHGWDLTYLFKRFCHAIAQSLDRDVTKCTVWYMDWPKTHLFVYATSGYDIEYKCDRVLPRESFIGQAVCSRRGTVHAANPLEDPLFVRKDKAARMGIARSLACPIYPPGEDDTEHGISALSIYFNLAEQDTPAVREAMKQVADALGALARGFEQVRQEFAAARLRHLQYAKPRSSESDFEVLLAFLQEVFDADGCSIFARQARDTKLYAVATTGLTTSRDTPKVERHAEESDTGWAGAVAEEDPRPVFYDLEKEEGFTVFLARQPGVVLRFNNLLDPQESGLPPHLPKQPLLKHRENFPPRNDDNRRFLGVGIELRGKARPRPGQEDTLGVTRILRRPGSKPFTLCDERLLLTLASVCRKQFLDWRRVEQVSGRCGERQPAARVLRTDAAPSSVRAFARILRAIPVTRSTRTLTEELLNDLYECYRPHGIARSRLLIRHHGGGLGLFRVHALYEEPRREIPVDALPVRTEDEPYLSDLFYPGTDGGADLRPLIVTFSRERLPGCPAGLRVPVRTWTEHGLVDGVLALDFSRPVVWSEHDIDPAFYASCRLAATLGTTDPLGTADEVISPEIRCWDWRTILEKCREGIQHRFDLDWSRIHWGRLPHPERWQPLGEKEYREETLYGVRCHVQERRLAIPLRLGPVPMGYFLCEGLTDAPGERLRRVLASVTAFWTHLSFSRCGHWQLLFAARAETTTARLWQAQLRLEQNTIAEQSGRLTRLGSLFTEVPDLPLRT